MSGRRTRDRVPWTPSEVNAVAALMEVFGPAQIVPYLGNTKTPSQIATLVRSLLWPGTGKRARVVPDEDVLGEIRERLMQKIYVPAGVGGALKVWTLEDAQIVAALRDTCPASAVPPFLQDKSLTPQEVLDCMLHLRRVDFDDDLLDSIRSRCFPSPPPASLPPPPPPLLASLPLPPPVQVHPPIFAQVPPTTPTPEKKKKRGGKRGLGWSRRDLALATVLVRARLPVAEIARHLSTTRSVTAIPQAVRTGRISAAEEIEALARMRAIFSDLHLPVPSIADTADTDTDTGEIDEEEETTTQLEHEMLIFAYERNVGGRTVMV